MEVTLSKDSIVDKRTGEVETPTEYLANLREVEVNIARSDSEIAALKADLKAARDRREKLVDQLRASVRDGEVLPLFEQEQEEDDEPDNVAGLDVVED